MSGHRIFPHSAGTAEVPCILFYESASSSTPPSLMVPSTTARPHNTYIFLTVIVSLKQQELGSEAASASEVTEKMEDITAAKVKTETEEPAAVETLPVQVEESSKEVRMPTQIHSTYIRLARTADFET